MALKVNFSFNTQYGVPAIVNDCYAKVQMIEASKESGNARVVFYDKPEGKILDDVFYPIKIELNGINFIEQAYIQLKQHPDFKGAVDA